MCGVLELPVPELHVDALSGAQRAVFVFPVGKPQDSATVLVSRSSRFERSIPGGNQIEAARY